MIITEKVFQDGVVLTFSGAFDHYADRAFRVAVGRLHQLRRPHMIFDLTNLTALDSAGSGLLIMALHGLRHRGCVCSLIPPSGDMRKELERADLPSLAHMWNDEGEAWGLG